MKGEYTDGLGAKKGLNPQSTANTEIIRDLIKTDFTTNESIIETVYCVNNVMMRFFNYSEHIQQEIDHLLSSYLQSENTEKKDGEIHIHIRPPLPMETLQTISDENELLHSTHLYPGVLFQVYKHKDIIYFTALNDRCAVLDIYNNSAVCYTPENLDRKRFHRVIFTLIFPLINEFFALRGQYFLHCASISKDEQGILFAAMSGGGKSTLTLTALSAGYKLINDDLTILDVNGDTPRFVSFTKEMRICPDVLPMFPKLAYLLECPLDDGKISIWPNAVFHDCMIESVRACIVLIPSDDIGAGISDYMRIDTGEAIELLYPHALFVTGKYAIQKRLFAILDLLKNVRVYKVRVKPDIDRIPLILENIINDNQ